MPKDGNIKRRVRRGRFDSTNMVVTLGTGPNEHRYTSVGLPQAVITYLTLLGLKSALLLNQDTDHAYAVLKSGVIPEQRPQAIPRKSKWREAIAYALASYKATTTAPKGTKRAAIDQMINAELPAMKDHAATLSKETIRKLGERADVQEHYRRMFGSKLSDQQTSILALAGVLEPMGLPRGEYEPEQQTAA